MLNIRGMSIVENFLTGVIRFVLGLTTYIEKISVYIAVSLLYAESSSVIEVY